MKTTKLNNEMQTYLKKYNTAKLIEAELIAKDLNSRITKLNNKQEAIKNLQYEHNLIESDIIHFIKIELYHSEFNLFKLIDDLFIQAIKYINRKNINWEESKYTKEACKHAYTIIISIVSKYILKNKPGFKLDTILDYFFGCYYELEFIYKRKRIRIDIPMYKAVNPNNYTELLYGYRVYIKTGSNSWLQLFTNVDYRVIADNLEKYINEEMNNNDK